MQTEKVAEKCVKDQRKRLASNLLHIGQEPKWVGLLVDKILSTAGADAGGLKHLAALAKNTRSSSAAKVLVNTLREAEAANVDPMTALRAAGLIADLGGR